MKKILFTLLALVMLGGCSLYGGDITYLTNSQIIEETKYCEDNGMRASQIINGWNYRVRRIQCEPITLTP